LLLSTGKTIAGVWTGGIWWGNGKELDPVDWRWVDNTGLSYIPQRRAFDRIEPAI
jgi:hypothetical protein